MKTSVQPAWVLGRRAYRDSSLLVELLKADSGRASVVVKGAHRKQRGGSFASLMQPFCPILVALGGQSELKYLSSAETAGVAISLPGERLFSGFYMNELLVRLLPKWDSVPQLFASYGASLVELSEQADLDLTLRRFEIVLFEELGYEIQWATDHRGQRIKAESSYLFAPDRGFVERDQSESEGLLSGAALIKLNSWCRERTAVDEGARRVLKKMMRQAIDYRLDGLPLMVREAFGQLRGLSQPKGDE